jgi:adenylate kinase
MTTNRSGPEGPRVLVLGRPGSGKGTQSGRLAERLGVPHIATGDLFRATVAADTPLGRTVRGYMDAGDLVPDALVVDVVADRLGPDGAARGFVLDGFPRTVQQAEHLVDLLAPCELDLAIDLVVPADVVRARLAARRVCAECGRSVGAGSVVGPCAECGGVVTERADDDARAVTRRLAHYERLTRSLLDWLAARNLVVHVDGLGTPEEVAVRIDSATAALAYPDCSDLAS